MNVDTQSIGDSLHRLAKIALDSGEATSVDEALALFREYRLQICVGPSLASSAAQQAALLTAVNAARRAFLGGVVVVGFGDWPLIVPISNERSLKDAVLRLGAVFADSPMAGIRTIHIGDVAVQVAGGIRTIIRAWAAGCSPVIDDAFLDEPRSFVLAGVAAGALAVAECFQMARSSNPAAGRRRVGISLWRPDLDWLSPDAAGPVEYRLPTSAWLIGLGNLGQAYLWSLGMLPYLDPAALNLILQDFDRITPSNDSTSLLTDMSIVRKHKTRAMAWWAEARGFEASLIERRFAADFHVASEEPPVALCAVDNGLARTALEDVGFERIIEAGLGNGISDFLAIRLHTFPSERRARDIWSNVPEENRGLLEKPAYRALEAAGADKCGLVRLAGRTVGAPFVGAFAGALVIAELVKLANGAPNLALFDMHLRSPDQSLTVLQSEGFAYNPGATSGYF
jgi:hypothetical protein